MIRIYRKAFYIMVISYITYNLLIPLYAPVRTAGAEEGPASLQDGGLAAEDAGQAEEGAVPTMKQVDEFEASIKKITADKCAVEEELKAAEKKFYGEKKRLEKAAGKLGPKEKKFAADLSRAEDDKVKLEKELEEADAAAQAAYSGSQELEKEAGARKARIGQLEAALEKASLEREGIKKSLDSISPDEEDFAARRKEIEAALAAKEAGLKQFEGELKEAKGSERKGDDVYSKADQKLKDAEEEVRKAREKLFAKKIRIRDIEKSVSKNKSDRQEMDSKLTAMEKEMGSRIEELRARSRVLSGEKKGREDQLAGVIEAIRSVKKIDKLTGEKARSARKRRGKLPSDVETLKGVILRQDEEIASLEKESGEFARQVREAEALAREAERNMVASRAKLIDTQITVNKERLDMHFNLAVIYEKARLYKDAEREYLKCLKIDSTDAGVYYNLGILYDDKLNSNHKALVNYNKYLELRPKGEKPHLVREWITNIELEQRIGPETR